MTTVQQAFQTFLQKLELSEAERSEASGQQSVLRDALRTHLGGVTRDILSGSFARRTAIRPLNDIDLFVILDPRIHAHSYPPASPETCLQKVMTALQTAYPRHTPRLQGRSVHIEFSGTGIGYDIVPAFEERVGGEYKIPDRGRREWIRTNPEKHMAVFQAANERAGGKLNALIKAAKHWNYQQPAAAQLRSFHLEVMSYGALPSAPPSLPEGLVSLFSALADRVFWTCADPVGIGPNIDFGMTQPERSAAQAALRGAATTASEALSLDRAGRSADAHARWRTLLGKEYPGAA